MPAPVLPHLVPDADSLALDGWQLLSGDEWVPLPDAVDSWDYNTDLQVRFSGRIDAERFMRSTGLDDTASLAWTLSWRNTEGRLSGCVAAQPTTLTSAFALEGILRGSDLGPVVELRATLALAEPFSSSAPGVATRAGSVLHTDRARVVLVGDLARFPATTTDFAARGLDPDASWALDIPTDLNTPVLGGIVLLINERDTELVVAVSTGSSRGKGLRDHLHEEVAAQLLDHAVANAELLQADDWEPDTLGSVLWHLAARADGGLPRLTALRGDDPAKYRALLIGEARRSGLGRSLS